MGKFSAAKPGLPAPTEARAPPPAKVKEEDPPSNHTAPWHPSLVNEGVSYAMGPAQVPRTMGEIISFITIAGRLAFVDN